MGTQCVQEGGGASLTVRAAFWGLNGLIQGIVRASAPVRPTRCLAHPQRPSKTVHPCPFLATVCPAPN